MGIYQVSYAGHHLNIQYDSENTLEFLNFLFSDLSCMPSSESSVELSIFQQENSDFFVISAQDKVLFHGHLGVQAAATLYDAVVFNLLNSNRSGVALHAGAVSYQGKLLIIPGESGAGKSSVVAWLVAHGFSYLTDELIFFPDQEMTNIVPFTRPVCLKTGSANAFSPGNYNLTANWLRDEFGAIIPHRLLNPTVFDQAQCPELILFPSYQRDLPSSVSAISAAQASTRLMACCANARNLRGHGFREIVTLSRKLPSFQLTFNSFSCLETVVDRLIQTHKTSF